METSDEPIQAHVSDRFKDQPQPQPQPQPQVGDILGTAIKKEVKQEQQKAEDRAYEEILGPRKKRLTTAPKTTTPEQTTQPTPKLYTHAHGHQCTRENCDPIIISKRGIIKPSRPVTAHTHISKYICDKMKESRPDQSAKSSDTIICETNQDTTDEPIPDKITTTAHATKSIDTVEPPDANLLTISAEIHTEPANDEVETAFANKTDNQENESRSSLLPKATTTADVHVDAPATKSIEN